MTEPMPSKWERRENKVRSKRDGKLSRKIMNRSRDKVKTRENSKAFSKEIRLIYEANTNRARDLGIFGVPSFIVENEIFWGDDRLEDAIAFSSRHL